MTKKQKIMCNSIIHAASVAAATVGAGLAQVPCSDSAIITPTQMAMTVALGKVFGVKLSKASAKSAMGTGMTTMVGRAASQVLVGWIPGAGNVINAVTAASITEALGWILVKEFEKEYGTPVEEIETDEMFKNKLIEWTGGAENECKAENYGIESFEEINGKTGILQENRLVC